MPNNTFVPFAGRSTPFVDVLPANIVTGGLLSGNGSPEGVMPGTPGQRYRDLVNDALWIKIRGNQAQGWQQVGISPGEEGGGGEKCADIFFGPANDPNNVITATAPAIYYASTGSVWVKTDTGLGATNTGWAQVVGP